MNWAKTDIPRGLVACPPTEKNAPRITSFIALVAITDHPSTIHVGYCPFICVHTRTVTCRLINIIDRVDKSNGNCSFTKSNNTYLLVGNVLEAAPKSIKKGDAAHVEFEPIGPIFVEPISKCAALARFVARDGHGTVAVGVIKSVVEARNVAAPPTVPTKSKLLNVKHKQPARKR